jgi:hypothetical protein
MTTNIEDPREKTGTRSPGRPPKAPEDKIGRPVRCLITENVFHVLSNGGDNHQASQSDYLRLALYHELERDGKMTEELRKDATWDALRRSGLI